MTNKVLEGIWEAFPESHLHCDVTIAGLDSYRVVASVISPDGDTIATVEHYGSGDLDGLKHEAFKRIAEQIRKEPEG